MTDKAAVSPKTKLPKVCSPITEKQWKEVVETKAKKDEKQLSKDDWDNLLVDWLDTQHLVVLAGSGTSLGSKVKGPSMATLYDVATKIKDFKKIAGNIKYDENKKNIELLLSRCQSSLDLLEGVAKSEVQEFIKTTEKAIANHCRVFLEKADLSSHETFLRRLSRRSLSRPRLQFFTTNYDLCFEKAASQIECPVVDGFSLSVPQSYSPRFFSYDVVRRSTDRNETPEYVEGVFHLYKVHGSVDWTRADSGKIIRDPNTDRPCLIYPASTKYEHSYSQPFLEMMARFLACLRQPNTTLVVLGFGFNDDHLSQPILSALSVNSGFRVVVVDPTMKEKSENIKSVHHRILKAFIDENDDRVMLVEADFDDFAYCIPNITRQTQEERLAYVVQQIAKRDK